ncbi:MAG TPA: chloride channel protein [Thermoanaerobaculia bacterium]|nr:chloride channel protein [Thermoanaerobaculia bacterium]
MSAPDPIEPAEPVEPVAPSRRPRFGSFLWRDPNTRFLLLAVVAGLLGALGAVVFRFLTSRLTRLLLDASDIVVGAEALPPLLRIFLPAIGGLVGGLLLIWLVDEKGPSGISAMIDSVSLGRRPIRVRPAVGRVASSIAVISTGGSEGREGPIIQIGAALASSLSRRLKVSPDRVRILTACGMAAGVAGAYNTPIAATLFVLEVVVGSFAMRLFGPAVVSAVVSTVVVRLILGDEPVYQVAPFRLESIFEFLPFAAIGLIAGPASAVFAKALRESKKIFEAIKLPRPITMAIGGAIVGAIGIALPEVWGNGFEANNRILRGNPTLLTLALLFVGKIVATCSTIGSGGVGGVFTPSLLVGATVGGAVAKIFQAVTPWLEAPVGGYALLGMGGLLAGLTRAPLLAILMIFELTQNTEVLLPMMVVSVIAALTARVFEKDSIYVSSLRSSGVAWESTPEATGISTLKVADIMRQDVKLIPRNTPLSEIIKAFLTTRSLYLYVGDEEGRLLGVVDLHDIKENFLDRELGAVVIAEDLVTEIPCVTPQESLTSVNEKLWFRDLGHLPVVDSLEDRRFLGIVTRRDLLGAIDREVLQRSRLVARVRTFSEEEGGGEMDYFELPEKHRMIELDTPRGLAGRSVAESGIRTRYGVSVLAVKRRTREGLERRFVPGPEDRFQPGDVLIVLGTEDAIERLRSA